jgi:hypothetical protein
MLERDFQRDVLEIAKFYHWHHYHTHDSRRSPKGFPDLVLWRDRVIFAELKASRGRVSQEQTMVMDKLKEAGAEVYLWRPENWVEIGQVLSGQKK